MVERLMEKFVYVSQFIVIALYAFNTLAYSYLGYWNKAFYWACATGLCIAILRMK